SKAAAMTKLSCWCLTKGNVTSRIIEHAMRLLFEIFAQTLRTLWAHKLRSFLTMFGIAWGVGSLLLLVGLGEGFRSGNRKPIEDGRWLNELDDTQKRAVVVLGDEARRVLFPGRPSVGSTILLNGVRFQVIGTLKRIGHGDNNTLNLRIFIPFNTMKMNFRPLNVGGTNEAISFINYQPRS